MPVSSCDKGSIQDSIVNYIKHLLCKEISDAEPSDFCLALSFALRDLMVERILDTEHRYHKAGAKRLYYLSMEFLIGRSLGNNLINLGLLGTAQEALHELGANIEDVFEEEQDAALGNGGLGRLAACFIDSLATKDMPGYGYGIHYEYGLFKQVIENGWQREKPDHWLGEFRPLEIPRPDLACLVPIYGRVEYIEDPAGVLQPMWLDWNVVVGMPYDIPVAGYRGETVNLLRLFAARPSTEFDISVFNAGDYFQALEQKIESEKISKILYPSDTVWAGKELRLLQEYFLVACSLRNIVRNFLKDQSDFRFFPKKTAIQLNDTHPALSVAELMRILVDEYALSWDQALEITRQTFSYTNHTLLPEALETWPVRLMEEILPRHMQLIYDINASFLDQVESIWPGDGDRRRRMSMIEEGPERSVRMAHLAIAGSHAVNGVSSLHTELLKTSVVTDFYDLWPDKFVNVTNGITQRRWLLKANPDLADLITEAIGDRWTVDLGYLTELEALSQDAGFQDAFLQIKKKNKQRLGRHIAQSAWIKTSPESFFDIQAKRIHEYKRQLLFLLAIVNEYLEVIDNGRQIEFPKTFVFSGKAAPGYRLAKQIIYLIHCVADTINRDSRTRDRLKVVFVPDYKVSVAEKIIPAADLSEQISTAGKEASGTGNMKFALNGALTLGTLDGANIEILEEVGQENIYIFGHTASEIASLRRDGQYRARDYYESNPELKRTLDSFISGRFSPADPKTCAWLYSYLIDKGDTFFNLADFASYIKMRQQIYTDYLDTNAWAERAILNVARIGKFSSDRAVQEYASKIWNLDPVPSEDRCLRG